MTQRLGPLIELYASVVYEPNGVLNDIHMLTHSSSPGPFKRGHLDREKLSNLFMLLRASELRLFGSKNDVS